MRIFEHSFPPGLHELALRRKNLDRNFPSIEGPYVPIRSNGQTRHGGPFPSGGLFQWPIGIGSIDDGVVSSRIWHGVLGLRECRRGIQQYEASEQQQTWSNENA